MIEFLQQRFQRNTIPETICPQSDTVVNKNSLIRREMICATEANYDSSSSDEYFIPSNDALTDAIRREENFSHYPSSPSIYLSYLLD